MAKANTSRRPALGQPLVRRLILRGHGNFAPSDARGVTVRYWLPENFATDAPILFVLPGIDRDARAYRDVWVPHARRAGALLLVPEFDPVAYPGSRSYNLGNMFNSQGRPRPRWEWSFSKIEDLFEQIRDMVGGSQACYRIYGHSAGAQFVQRLALFVPEARIETAVSANAGWYTFPDFSARYPYGLAGTRLSERDLTIAFGQDYVILLGDQDVDQTHPTLRNTAEALGQGPNRMARGLAFFEAARAKAAELGVPFRWRRSIVRGATHSNADMAAAAAHVLLARD